MSDPIDPVAGDIYTAPYPFVRDTYVKYEAETTDLVEAPTWKPGAVLESVGPYHEEVAAVADGVGSVIYTVIDIHKPGRFPTRVFYTRQWVTPEGKMFGKVKLHIDTMEKFRRLVRGYRFDFELRDEAA
jgi:hypothetical protein